MTSVNLLAPLLKQSINAEAEVAFSFLGKLTKTPISTSVNGTGVDTLIFHVFCQSPVRSTLHSTGHKYSLTGRSIKFDQIFL